MYLAESICRKQNVSQKSPGVKGLLIGQVGLVGAGVSRVYMLYDLAILKDSSARNAFDFIVVKHLGAEDFALEEFAVLIDARYWIAGHASCLRSRESRLPHAGHLRMTFIESLRFACVLVCLCLIPLRARNRIRQRQSLRATFRSASCTCLSL